MNDKETNIGGSELYWAIEAARAGGGVLKEMVAEPHQVMYKSPKSPVSDADISSEAAIIDVLHGQFPQHEILTEENAKSELSSDILPRFLWVIDPLDGTTNFIRGIPFFCVSIALFVQSKLRLGVVYDPLRDESYLAEYGSKGYLGTIPLKVTATSGLRSGLIGFDWPRSDALRKRCTEYVGQLATSARSLRVMGSAALALGYVARGILDGYFHLDSDPWDAAAGIILVESSGGKVTGLEGQPWDINTRAFLASNGKLHSELVNMFGKD